MLVGVLAITLYCWYGVLAGSFQYDDYPNVVNDPATSDPTVFLSRLTTGFRPLLRASYFLDHQIWGMYAPGFLATNLILHLLAVAVVFELARRRLESVPGACIAAMFFAVQPAHAEVIAYVSGRSSGLSATLLLLGLMFYDRSACPDGHQDSNAIEKKLWLAPALALWICAVLVKETALVFPLLLMVWEITRPEPCAGIGRRLLPFLIAWILLGIGLFAVPRYQELLSFSFSVRSPLESLVYNVAALPETLSLWLRPWALAIEHQLPVWNALQAAACSAILLCLALYALVCRHRAPHAAFAILFVLAAMLPTHSIVAKLDPVTEKPLYLAWVGVALLAGAFTARHARSPVVMALIAAAVIGGTIWSAKRVAVWQNPVALWTEAVGAAPGSARAWNNLGMARFIEGDLDGAEAAFTRTLELDPRHPQAFDARLTIRLLRETNSAPRAMELQ